MSLPSYLKPHPDGTLLAIKAQPRASRNEIAEPLGDELKIKITAPPVDSAANKALIQFLAQVLDCPRSHIELLRGQAARHKTILIHHLTPEETAHLLSRSAKAESAKSQKGKS